MRHAGGAAIRTPTVSPPLLRGSLRGLDPDHASSRKRESRQLAQNDVKVVANFASRTLHSLAYSSPLNALSRIDGSSASSSVAVCP